MPTLTFNYIDADLRAAGFTLDGGYFPAPEEDDASDYNWYHVRPDGVRVCVQGLPVADRTAATPIVNAADIHLQRPRNLLQLIVSLRALPAADKAAIWTDFTGGSPPKWSLAYGPPTDESLMDAMTLAEFVGSLTGAERTEARLRAVALYCRIYPRYLVNPPFAPAVNVKGSEAIP